MKNEENIALIEQELSDFKIDRSSIKELLEVKVTTAKKLTSAEYQSISAILTEKLGSEIYMNKVVDPAILGGIIVQVGDKVFDASALRKLRKMEVVMDGIDIHEYSLQDTAKISDAMGDKLENYTVDVDLEEVGIVEKIGDGIATVIGMKNAMAGEMVELPNGVTGKISQLAISGESHIQFIIGGSLGLSEKVLKEADLLLSFSKMTFPHQLMRVILLEQIYRSYRIIQGEPYHK